ncbi:flagellin [Pseudoalteromonas byunsanensis]|uniref:Flagellin n=1 Tax=Pseudoalteromonas byunsanensis TaxID=327939 RepID=A0A1S1N3P5_9GAMM|nr:flagellin [Pseudoalteromonas byunsanensis]OHU94028.1 hypothetical protein BIW53_17565 [Pseudoalteromonas byunsanensis]
MLSINGFLSRHQFAANKLTDEQRGLSQALSSGKRINSAKDDAAGLQLSNRLQTQLKVKEQVQKNINDGISYGQVADSALGGVSEHLQRIRTLLLQAANESYSDADRASLDQEIKANIQAIDQLAEQTEVFGKKPLLSVKEPPPVVLPPEPPPPPPPPPPIENVDTLDRVLTNGVTATDRSSGYISFGLIPEGSKNVRIYLYDHGANDDIAIFSANGEHLVGSDLSAVQNVVERNLFTPANGYTGDESYDNSLLFDGGRFNLPARNSRVIRDMQFTYSGDGNIAQNNRYEELHFDVVTEHLLLSVIGNGRFDITASWDEIAELPQPEPPPEPEPPTEPVVAPSVSRETDGPMVVTVKDLAVGENGYVIFDDIEASAHSLGLEDFVVASSGDAQGFIETIDKAIATVGQFRADIGSKINALAHVHRNQINQHEYLSSAHQRITDADYAADISRKVKSDTLQQAQLTLATQANKSFSQSMMSIINLLA